MNVDLSAGRQPRSRASAPASGRCWWSRKASPNYIEQAIGTDAAPAPTCRRRAARQGHAARWPANTPAAWCAKGMRAVRRAATAGSDRRSGAASTHAGAAASRQRAGRRRRERARRARRALCTGCPERPIFTAMKLVERELGAAPRQRRHRLPPVLDPAAVQHRQHHHGLRPRRGRRRGAQRHGRQARDLDDGRRRLLAQRPDQRHRQRGVQQQRQPDRSSSTTTTPRPPAARTSCRRTRATAPRSTGNPIEKAVRGVGVEWVRTIRRTYDVPACATRCARR